MPDFKSIRSFKIKLLFIIWLSSTVTLLLACGCFIFFAVTEFNRNLLSEMEPVVHSITDKSAQAIRLNDNALAEDALYSVADTVTAIENAVIYDGKANVIASYSRNISDRNDFAIPEPQQNTTFIKGDHLYVFSDIKLHNVRVGSIYLKVSRQTLSKRIQHYVSLLVGLMGILLIFLAAISFFLQKLISTPVMALISSAKEPPTLFNNISTSQVLFS